MVFKKRLSTFESSFEEMEGKLGFFSGPHGENKLIFINRGSMIASPEVVIVPGNYLILVTLCSIFEDVMVELMKCTSRMNRWIAIKVCTQQPFVLDQ
jgi:hypothetical protein